MIGRNRKYVSGTDCCLWRWSDVDSQYITRLHLIKTPWFAVCLHWLNKPDPEPFLHDHPVSFLSIILRGWYKEYRRDLAGATRMRHREWFNYIRASYWDQHTIVDMPSTGALTLCLMGPKVREWGFHTPEGWVGWKAYYAKQRAERERIGRLHKIFSEVDGIQIGRGLPPSWL